jgi:ATP-dependent Lon protease
VRSKAHKIGIDQESFRRSDLHVHFPAGSVPKDGPSAGVAVTLAIASAFSRRPVRRDIAMTGEVTLRGRILEIGGATEKVLAAYRSGLREVLLPSLNALQDLRDLPKEVATTLMLHGVRTMDQVFARALLPVVEDDAGINVEHDHVIHRPAVAASEGDAAPRAS